MHVIRYRYRNESMHVNKLDLISALGIKVPENAGNVNKINCPMHPKGAMTMRIYENQNTGDVHFECGDPDCGFIGDALALICTALDVSPGDAVRLLRPGGHLAHILPEPLMEVEAKALAERQVAVAKLQAYIAKCRQRLKLHPEHCKVRAGMSRNTLRLVPKEVGILVHEDTPHGLKRFQRGRHKDVQHTIYPYTYNGEITKVVVQDHDNPDILHTVELVKDSGVFMEQFSEAPWNLLVAPDARTASLLYGTSMSDGSRKPWIVAAEFPLPESLRSVQVVNLLYDSKRPADIANVLNILANDIISGSCNQPAVNIVELSGELENIQANTLRIMWDPQAVQRTSNFKDAMSWICEQLIALVSSGKHAMAAAIIESADLPSRARAAFYNRLKELSAPEDLVELLSEDTVSLHKTALGNGRPLRSDNTGISGLNGHGKKVILSNIGIEVRKKVRAYDEDEVLTCVLTTEDPTVPPLHVKLRSADRENAKALRASVSSAFAEAGLNPYIAFYTVTGYDWSDVFGKLSEKCEFSYEVRELGIDDSGDLHLPKCIIKHSDMSVIEQERIFTMPDNVTEMYSGIPAELSPSALQPIKRLFENCDNFHAAVYTLALCHFVYHATFPACGAYGSALAKRQPKRHLMLVDNDVGTLTPLFNQFATMFSGIGAAVVDYGSPRECMESYKQLGGLPLIAGIPAIPGTRLADAIAKSGLSVIGIMDNTTAAALNGKAQCTYIAPGPSELPAVLDMSMIDDIRSALPSFLLSYISNIEHSTRYATANTPALACYDVCCTLLGVEPKPIANICRQFFPGAGMTGADAFFDVLRRRLENVEETRGRRTSRRRITVVHDAPEVNENMGVDGKHIFIMPDSVIVSRSIIDLVNLQQYLFTVNDLTRDFMQRGLLQPVPYDIDVKANDCWVFDRNFWEITMNRANSRLLDPGGINEIAVISLN